MAHLYSIKVRTKLYKCAMLNVKARYMLCIMCFITIIHIYCSAASLKCQCPVKEKVKTMNRNKIQQSAVNGEVGKWKIKAL